MAWWDSFTGSSDAGSLYGFGNMASDWFSNSGGSSGGGSSWWGTAANAVGDYFSNSGSSGNTNIWGSVLSGLGGAASAYLQGKDAEQNLELAGNIQRRNLSFTAALEDYYNQKNKARDKAAVDTYGQFSLVDRIFPTQNTPVDVPQMPTP